MATRVYRSAHRRRVKLDSDGNFYQFIADIDDDHIGCGFWQFYRTEDHQHARQIGLTSPEQALNDVLFDHWAHEDILLCWVPGYYDKNLTNPLVGSPADHIAEIHAMREYLGLNRSFRDGIPFYHIDQRLEHFWPEAARESLDDYRRLPSLRARGGRATASPPDTPIPGTPMGGPAPQQPNMGWEVAPESQPTSWVAPGHAAPSTSSSELDVSNASNFHTYPSGSLDDQVTRIHVLENEGSSSNLLPNEAAEASSAPKSRCQRCYRNKKKCDMHRPCSNCRTFDECIPVNKEFKQDLRAKQEAKKLTPKKSDTTYDSIVDMDIHDLSTPTKANKPSFPHQHESPEEGLPTTNTPVSPHTVLPSIETQQPAYLGQYQMQTTSPHTAESLQEDSPVMSLGARFVQSSDHTQAMGYMPMRNDAQDTSGDTSRGIQQEPSIQDPFIPGSNYFTAASIAGLHEGHATSEEGDVTRIAHEIQPNLAPTPLSPFPAFDPTIVSEEDLYSQWFRTEEREDHEGHGDHDEFNEHEEHEEHAEHAEHGSYTPSVTFGTSDEAIMEYERAAHALPCLNCGKEAGHQADCSIGNFLPMENLHALHHRTLGDMAENFDSRADIEDNAWFIGPELGGVFNPRLETREEVFHGMIDVIRNEESYRNNPVLQAMPDDMMMLFWGLQESGTIDKDATEADFGLDFDLDLVPFGHQPSDKQE